jgi:gliding motility-associated-like protein
LSRTASTAEGGWAVNGGGALQTQNYPDVDLSNNTAVNCALPACDTVYVDVEVIEYITDTITLVEIDTVILYDTTYITLPPDTVILTQVDTLIEYIQLPPDTIYEYLTDTITLIETEYIDVIIDNYVYVTDTITEFVSITTYIDCETGEQCGELSPCDETSIYAPNVVTPNDDGWNDTWQIIADGACWNQWEVRVYNRWGGLVWISASSNDEWDANVATGVYVYTITAHSSTSASVFEFNGTITVLY